MSQFNASFSDFGSVCLSETELAQNHFPGFDRLQNVQGFITLPVRHKRALPLASIMCEFCRTTQGLEIVRVTVVNQEFRVVLNEFIRPSGVVVDPMTRIHGIETWCYKNSPFTLVDVQSELCKLCDQSTVLVGHGLDCDLIGLKLVHGRCADTKLLYKLPHKEMSLPMLSELVLGRPIANDIEYPRATMELVWLYMVGQMKNQQQHRSRTPPQSTTQPVEHCRMNLTMYDSGSSSGSASPPAPGTVKQRPFGEKQELIARVHERLIQIYRSRLVRPVGNCLRGQDTIRIHCKKWDQLLHIETLLAQIEQVKKFHQICLPISMKTKSQKKGFFVYLKFYNTSDVREVLNLIGQSSLYKAEIAGPHISARKRRRQSMF